MSPRKHPGRQRFGMPAAPANNHPRFGSRGTRAISKIRKGVSEMPAVARQDHPGLYEVLNGPGKSLCGCAWDKYGTLTQECAACARVRDAREDRAEKRKAKFGGWR